MSALNSRKCSKCKETKKSGDFYVSLSPLHDGKLPFCKICTRKKLDFTKIDSVTDTLRMIDRPFIKFLWDSTFEQGYEVGKDVFGLYMKNIGMKQYRELTWKDSVFEMKNEAIPIETDGEDEGESYSSNFKVTEKIIDKWGYGYKDEEYEQFERKFNKLIKNYGEKTALHTEGLLVYIRFRVKEEMATAKGQVKEAREWGALASKQAQDAKINVSQLSKSDISGGVDVLAQLFEAVETEVGVIPLLPQLIEQPYDDADLIIWATVNYNRRLEDKSKVAYKDIWEFYDEMLEEHFNTQGYTKKESDEFKAKRNNVFRDLEKVYVEPLYENEGE
jgi:hypothetical protein